MIGFPDYFEHVYSVQDAGDERFIWKTHFSGRSVSGKLLLFPLSAERHAA